MSLPVEILIEIACESIGAFRAMLALRPVVEFMRCNRKYVIDKLTKIVVDDRCTRYFIGTGLHREGDLPAVEYHNGDKIWMQRGCVYRDNESRDKPTKEYSNGGKEWCEDGCSYIAEVPFYAMSNFYLYSGGCANLVYSV